MIEDILEEIETATGKLDKRAILKKHLVTKRNEHFAEMLKITFDPNVTFGIKSITTKGTGKDCIDWPLFRHLLRELETGVLTGNDAKNTVAALLREMTPRSAEWATRILKKNLRIGVSDETIEKIDPTLASVFKVPLAETFEKMPEGYTHGVDYICQPKLDGVRAVAIANGPSADKIKLFSRSGLEWTNPNYAPIKQALAKALAATEVKYPFYTDGEIIVAGKDGVPDWNLMQHVMHCDSIVPEAAEIRYVIFDACAEQEWKNPQNSYLSRYRLAEYVASRSQSKHLKVIEAFEVKSPTYQIIQNHCFTFIAQGYEGAMFREANAEVENKRSRSLFKVKLFKDDEATVVGYTLGEGKLAGVVGALKCKTKDGALFEIGTGLSEFRRKWLLDNWNKINNSPVTFKYQELSGDGVPRFPVFKGIRLKEDL